MSLIWLLLHLAGAIQQSRTIQLDLEPALPSGRYYIGYQCSTVSRDYIKEVCSLCNSELAYTVEYGNAQYLEGYYAEDLNRILEAIELVRDQLPPAERYSIAIDENSVCLAGYSFYEAMDYDQIYTFFGKVNATNIHPPEIFDLDNETSLQYLSTRYSSEEFNYLGLGYTSLSTYAVTDTFRYQLNNMYISFEDQKGSIQYLGSVESRNATYVNDVEFRINTDYNRAVGEDFTVEVLVDNKYKAADWWRIVNPNANCEEVPPPNGISKLGEFDIQVMRMEYTVDTETLEPRLQVSASEFPFFDFAFFQEIIVTNTTAYLEMIDNKCQYRIAGDWTLLDELDMTISIISTAEENRGYAKLKDMDELTIGDIDYYFFKVFFPDTGSMIPSFTPTIPLFFEEVVDSVLIDPDINFVLFNGEISFQISGETEAWNNSLYIGIICAWVNGIPQSAFEYFYGSSLGERQLQNRGLQLTAAIIYWASASIDTEVYPQMRPDWIASPPIWEQGFNIFAEVQLQQDCFGFCALVRNYASYGQDTIYLTGSVFGRNIKINYPVEEMQLNDYVTLTEGSLMLDIVGNGFALAIKGAFTIQADKSTSLRFEGSITEGPDGEALLNSSSSQVWETPFAVDNLWLTGISITGVVDETGRFIKSNCTGFSYIGDSCYVDGENTGECLIGQADILIRMDDLKNGGLRVVMSNISNKDFLNLVAGYSYKAAEDMPLGFQLVNIEGGLRLDYKYLNTEENSIQISSIASYAGVFGDLTGKTDSFATPEIEFQVKLQDFAFVQGNAMFLDPVVQVAGDRRAGKFKAEFDGKLEMFSQITDFTLDVTDQYQGNATFNPFNGVISCELSLLGSKDLDISKSQFTIQMTIDKETTNELEYDIRTKAKQWFENTQNALNTLTQTVLDLSHKVTETQSNLCDFNEECPMLQVCDKIPADVCVEYTTKTECASEATSCLSSSLTCAKTEDFCVEFEKCDEDQCDCLESIEICIEQEVKCEKSGNVCVEQEVVNDLCVRYEKSCDFDFIVEPSCREVCETAVLLNQQAIKQYEVFNQALEETKEDFQRIEGLSYLTQIDMQANLFLTIDRLASLFMVESAGIGPNDLGFFCEGQIIDIRHGGLKPISLAFKINFFDARTTLDNLYEQIQKYLFADDSADLINKAPVEVSQENLKYIDEVLEAPELIDEIVPITTEVKYIIPSNLASELEDLGMEEEDEGFSNDISLEFGLQQSI